MHESVNSEGRPAVVPSEPDQLGGLVWIWSEEPDQPYFGLRASYLSAAGKRIFERSIDLDTVPEKALLVFVSSGTASAEINGHPVISTAAAGEVQVLPVAEFLQAGANALRLAVAIETETRAPAGLMGRLWIPGADGEVRIYPIDTTWSVRRGQSSAPAERPVIVGPYGIEPWGQLSGPLLPPVDFPRFTAQRYQRELELLREMTLRYFRYGSVPTYKDMWLPESYLWIGLNEPGEYNRNEVLWRTALRNRVIDDEGYVSTHQHIGLGHPLGWPFPFWIQAEGAGWAFSYEGFPYLEFRVKNFGFENADPAEWIFENAEVTGQSHPEGLDLTLTAANATMTSPPIEINHRVSPFFSMEWVADDLDGQAAPWLQWTTHDAPDFSPERQVPFTFDPDKRGRQRGLAELYRHPHYDGPITGLRIGFGNQVAGDIQLKILFSTQDTRHNGNNAQFIAGVHQFVTYTGDTDFLREQMPRMRKALRYAFEEFQIPQLKHVRNPWIGHEGFAGVEYRDGQKIIHFDRGMGNNFWDLLPFGGNDFYSSMLYFVALQRMAEMEETVQAHAAWELRGEDAFDPDYLRALAQQMKDHANDYFWNEATGRFPAAIDFDGVKHDYGFTFVNLEAIYYGFANEANARSIMEWINGDRLVPTDTAQGEDIYRWRFAPRASTLRNWEYYKFAAHASPERFPFGDQVQDGGAVLGFSFHDLMARHAVLGPDNAWQRFLEIMQWYEEVWDAGGYMAYYRDRPGTLQSPQPGGLGLHREFTEPSLMPLYILHGLFGFRAHIDGFQLNPSLPSTIDAFSVKRVRFQDALVNLSYRDGVASIHIESGDIGDAQLRLPEGQWQISYLSENGDRLSQKELTADAHGIRVPLQVKGSQHLQVHSK